MVTVRFAGLAILLALGMAYNAYALDISPGTEIGSGTENSTTAINTAAQAACGCTLTGVYKQENPSGEEGSFAGAYTTTFNGDASGGTIVYVAGQTPITGGSIYLLVKDGNHDPSWYLFDITGWNGTETITLSGFWSGVPGAISNVSIFTGPAQVPEPSSLLLLGSGLLALGIAARRRFKDR